MGSACHQSGGFRLIPVLQALIAKHGLENALELKGAFCLDKCMQGRTLKFEDRILTGLTDDNTEYRFATEILPFVRKS
jgi:NADH-quinone oxidoreductase subunit G